MIWNLNCLILLGLAILLGRLFPANLVAQTQELVYDNYVYDPVVRTVQFYREGYPMSFPYLTLAQGSRLMLEFDELRDEPADDYNVTILHCNADWKPSELAYIEYTDGVQQDRIIQVQHSQNTLVSYNHYKYQFPSQNNQRLKVSGNYILKVYRSSDDQPVITRRFVVVDSRVIIQPAAGLANNPEQRFRLQAVNFNLLLGDLPVQNPNEDFRIHVLQNFRWDTRNILQKPAYNWPDRLEYIFDAANEFKGGNEFRMFDSRNAILSGFGVAKIEFERQYNVCWLRPDKPRLTNAYLSEPDINGSFVVGLTNATSSLTPDVQADYFNTKFKLVVAEKLEQGDVYIYGQLTDWKLSEAFRMHYIDGFYENEVLLKQGVYNYEYIVYEAATQTINETALEGSHMETENAYTLLVYWRRFGGRYDELIALKHINFYEPN
jgi:hypothetical protein